MVSDEALKKLQEQIAAWPMAQRFVVQQLIRDYLRNREDLRAYKDTGMTPEEVLPKDKADEIALKLMRLADLESLCSYDRLRELAEADNDGRVEVLSCKVGDVLYRGSPSGVVVHRVANVVYRGLTSRWYIDTIPNLPYASEELGKTVFLTREEAKKALETMRKGETEHA